MAKNPRTARFDLPHGLPRPVFWEDEGGEIWSKSLILLVGAPGFEPGTPSPPDWCANRAALRSDEMKPLFYRGILIFRFSSPPH